MSPRFDASVEQRDRGYTIRLPFDPKSAFGKVRAPVVVTVNGHAFRTTTMRYAGVDYIGLNRDVRGEAQCAAGSSASFSVEADTAPREVEVPESLAVALAGDVAARESSTACPTRTVANTRAGSARPSGPTRRSAESRAR